MLGGRIMFDPKTGLENVGIVKDLLNLCNEFFINPFVKQYSVATPECRFCGAIQKRDGTVVHSETDCPVIRYLKIIEKHKEFITKHSD